MYPIGTITKRLEMSADTLRYYEKIGLLKRIYRNEAGRRLYSEKDVSRLKFIKRAQRMGFTLAEIGNLLSFRENPQTAQPQVRELAHHKLKEIEGHLAEVTTLKKELSLLLSLCEASSEGCPILENLDGDA